jgi:peptidoglycan hydrolase-like protein with peptidoglycan-binding domain
MGYDINTLAGNIAYARYLYDTEGTGPWLASASCWDPTPLTAALHMGSTGSQVKTLQKMLNAFGYLVADSGPGSVGHETTTFGAATQRAVRAFQCDRDIVCAGTEKTSGYGMVGTKTRLALSRMDAKIMASSDLTATQY